MARGTLTSELRTVADDPDALLAYVEAQGWGDGFPVIAPTEAGPRDCAHVVLRARLHRMRQHERAHPGVSVRTGGGVGEILEHRRHHHGGRDAFTLADQRVVDTPRRARPSRSEADDRRVDAMREGSHLRTLLLLSLIHI